MPERGAGAVGCYERLCENSGGLWYSIIVIILYLEGGYAMHVQGEDRNESVMFAECLEDYVAAENQVRFIDCFVDRLDLSSLKFEKAVTKPTGRPPYNPAD